MTMKATRAATPSALAASTGASAPCFGATVKAQVIAARPSVTAAAPAQSTGPERAPLLSLALASTSQTAIAATGRLMKNTARQEIVWVSHPPSTGPTALVRPLAPAQIPTAWPLPLAS